GSPVLYASSPGTISAEAFRRAAGAATAKLSGISEITLALPTDSAAWLTAVAEGATIGTYSFVAYKTLEDDKAETHDTVRKIITSIAEADELVKRAGVVARATFITRDLVNTAPSHLFPGTFADEIEALVANSKVEATVLDEEALAEGGFGGLLGVGQG